MSPFPDSLQLIGALDAAIDDVDDVLIAVPSHAFRALLTQLKPLLRLDSAAVLGDQGLRARQRQAAE